jgi:anti-anti-sigma factor
VAERDLRAVWSLVPGDHACYAFASDADHRAVLTAFLREGLDGGEKVVVVGGDGAEETARAYLREAGVDPEPALRSGQFVTTRAEVAYLARGRLEPERHLAAFRAARLQALADGYDRVRFTVDMGWAAPQGDLLVDYERTATAAVAEMGAVGMCQYDARAFEPGLLERVRDAHPIQVLGSGLPIETTLLRLEAVEDPPGLRLSGEVDLAGLEAFRAAVAGRLGTLRTGQDLRLDLAGVEFLDCVGIGVILRAANAVAGRGRLILDSPTRAVRRIISVVGLERLPSVTVR